MKSKIRNSKSKGKDKKAKLQRAKPNLSCKEAAEWRAKLASWEKDWNAPGMEAYDKV